MKNLSPQNFTIGILGGGQLGRMLLQSASDWNLKIKVLGPDPEPCQNLAYEFVQGDFTDYETVYQFGKTVDILTIEIENVNVAALEKLQNEGIKIYPQPEVIKTIQDKGLQKLFYQKNGIPTGKFQLIESQKELQKYQGPFPVVQKLRTAGYDGRGVMILKSKKDLTQGFNEPSLLEEFVKMHKEIAIMVARSSNGEIKTYPAVEMQFHPGANLVDFLMAPAKISPQIEAKAQNIAVKLAQNLKIVGLLAVEMFVTKEGKILVNECAPRPHNSGHHTIEANITSQFEQHLRAILGLPLGETATKIPAIMVNLIGEKGYSGEAKYQGLEKVLALKGASVHLYGKKMTKPFRKMGHVTIVDKDPKQALKKAQIVKKALKIIA